MNGKTNLLHVASTSYTFAELFLFLSFSQYMVITTELGSKISFQFSFCQKQKKSAHNFRFSFYLETTIVEAEASKKNFSVGNKRSFCWATILYQGKRKAKNCETISCYSAPHQRPIVLLLFTNFFFFFSNDKIP